MATVTGTARSRREHHLPAWIPLGFAALVLAGFAQTYYLKFWFGTPVLPLLLHVHGLLMTSWVLLFIAQTRLVAAHRVDLHRRLGVLGGVLFVLVPVIGSIIAVHGAAAGHSPGPPPLMFLAVPLFNLVAFTSLAGGGLWLRRRHSDWHKRLMLVATLNLLPPAVGRFIAEYVHLPGLPLAFVLADLAIIGCMVHDRIRRGRLHPAFVWGLALTVLCQVVSLAIAATPAWLRVATWLTGMV